MRRAWKEGWGLHRFLKDYPAGSQQAAEEGSLSMAPRYESLQGLKPRFFWRVFGATEAMSCYKAASFVFCAASLYGQTAPTVQAVAAWSGCCLSAGQPLLRC